MNSLSLTVCIAVTVICVAAVGSPDAAYGQSVNHSPFITTWETTTAGESITIPVGGATGTYTVDWGDGSTTTHDGDATHVYDVAGTYTVQISGDFTRIKLSDDQTNAAKLRSIDQWGSIHWHTMEYAFGGATNMVYHANDAPDLYGVTDMSGMFAGTSSFNGNISDWDVSSVTDMSGMFTTATSFNQPLDSWDVSSVTDMSFMFTGTTFNQPLDSWDVSSVTDMSGMFFATSFNQPLDSWDVSSVTDMFGMFADAAAFNQPLDSWDVSSVTEMGDMFHHATSFNQPLDSWDVSSVTDMTFMFTDATAFDQNLGSWYINPDRIVIWTHAPGTVGSISAQNQFLNGQKPTFSLGTEGDSARFSITDDNMLRLDDVVPTQTSYTVNITAAGDNVFESGNNSRTVEVIVGRPFMTTWETTTAGESITIPVGGATGTYTVDWGDGSTTTHEGDASHVYDDAGTYTVQISGDFTRIKLGDDGVNAAKLRSIDQWGNVEWISMDSAFEGAVNMEYNASDTPDLSGVTSMNSMFTDADSFNGDISGWDVSSVTDMGGLFLSAESFNQPLDSWDVSSVTDMAGMFAKLSSFNQPLDSWDVSSVTDMAGMFRFATSFNQPLDSWDVSSVTIMTNMFSGAVSFNQPLDSWDVSNVTDMKGMFSGATSFDGDISSWDVSSVTTMWGMFASATSFNSPLNSWNVSSVTDMKGMFASATSFNQPLGSWDISSVTDMSFIFFSATSFNSPLNSWDVSSVTTMHNMFGGAFSFNQNLGDWYIVLGDTTVASTQTEVTTITAQNAFLDYYRPTYDVVAGGDGDQFTIDGTTLLSVSSDYTKDSYDITITATDVFGLPLSHSKDVAIMVTDDSDQATVTGTVFSDNNGNGLQDAGEEGITGYTMHAIELVTGQTKSVETAADGTYSFDITPNVTTLVQTGFFPPGHTVMDVESSWFSYVYPPSGQTATFDVGFYPVPEDEQVTLNLTMFLDENRNGMMDAGEGGIEGISFTVYTYTIGPETVTTDADGMVIQTDLVPADWAVTDLPEEYLVTVYRYERSDDTEGKNYDPTLLLADEPEPSSAHTMVIGLAPAS